MIVTKERLRTLLTELGVAAEAGDSLEGTLTFSALEDHLTDQTFEVTGSWRTGNSEGQGGMVIWEHSVRKASDDISALASVNKTERGFEKLEFKDAYDISCSLQQSSAASFNALWVGVDDPNPVILVTDAVRLGLPTFGKTHGWVPYEIPNDVLLHTRMHMNEDQVRGMIAHLQSWLDTGSLAIKP